MASHKVSARVKVFTALAVLLAAIITAGVLSVVFEAQKQYRAKQSKAETAASEAAKDITKDLQFAMTPLKLGVDYLQRNPGPSGTLNVSMGMLAGWMDLAPCGVASLMALTYSGRVVVTYPPQPAEWDNLDPLPPLPQSVRNNTIYGMKTGRWVIQDLVEGAEGYALTVMAPVFVPAMGRLDTWGWPLPQNSPECLNGSLPCYDAATGKRWWGTVSVLLGRDQVLTCGAAMQALASNGYGYRISLLEDAPGLVAPAALKPTVMFSDLDNCHSGISTAQGPLAPGLTVLVEVCIDHDYKLRWFEGALVGVIVGSIILVVVTALTVLTWMRNSELMQSLLPADAIQHLAKTMPSKASMGYRVTGTPAEKMITMFGMLAAGEQPPMADVLIVLSVLKQQGNIYIPTDLEEHVTQAAGMNEEVAAALMAQLKGASDPSTLVVRGKSLMFQDHTSNTLKTSFDPLCTALETYVVTVQVDLLEMLGNLARFPGQDPALSFWSTVIPSTAQNTPPDTPIPSAPRSPVTQRDSELAHSAPMPRLPSRMPSASYLSIGDATGSVNGPSSVRLPRVALLTRLEDVLMKSQSLLGEFDAWELADASNGHPLSCLAFWCMHKSGVVEDLGISVPQLIKFLRKIEAGYNDNPYHNRTHAADVLQSVHALLHTGGLRGTYADSFTTLACYLAAIIHDYDHRGVTNDFLINTRHDLAMAYNDRSPHENHHISAAYKLLSQPNCNFLSNLSAVEWVRMRKLVIELVLATDMKQHFAVIGAFSSTHRLPTAAMVKRITAQPGPTLQDTAFLISSQGGSTSRVSKEHQIRISPPQQRAHHPPPRKASSSSLVSPTLLNTQQLNSHQTDKTAEGLPAAVDEAERLLALQMLMKCADLGHICTSLHVHLKWVAALEEEMFLQGDQEKALGIPVSPLCDRMGSGVTKSQVSFFEVVVLPLLTNFSARFGTVKPMLQAAAANFFYWRDTVASPLSTNL